MSDPTKLLERVLRLIDQDTKRIKKFVAREARVLDKDTAATLCRYATTISSIKQDQKNEELEEKRRLERLSTDELIDLAKKTRARNQRSKSE